MTVYKEESGHFTHNGQRYDINKLFKLVHRYKEEEFNVTELEWILKASPCDCSLHTERVKNSDLDIPIIITKSQNRLVVLDGVHRLEKAVKLNKEKILGKFVEETLINSC